MCGERTGKHHISTGKLAGTARPVFVVRKAFVLPSPFDAAIGAARHAYPARRGEQRAVIECGHAADEHALQRAVLHRPTALAFRKQRHAIDRADQDRVGGRVCPLDVGPAVRQQNHR
jgi:hypothetical protein